jgi:putative transposase
MSRRVNFTLTDEQLAEIEQAINYSPHPEVHQRAIAIRLLHLGYKPDQVAELVAITANTIWTWHRRWRKDGIAGLEDRPKPGRKTKADGEYLRQLEAALASDPQQLGLAYHIWTLNKLRLYLHQQTGILLSYTRFRALLSKLNYVWRQPKHDLSALQDPQAQQVAGQVLDWLKKTSLSAPSPLSSFSSWTKRP